MTKSQAVLKRVVLNSKKKMVKESVSNCNGSLKKEKKKILKVLLTRMDFSKEVFKNGDNEFSKECSKPNKAQILSRKEKQPSKVPVPELITTPKGKLREKKETEINKPKNKVLRVVLTRFDHNERTDENLAEYVVQDDHTEELVANLSDKSDEAAKYVSCEILEESNLTFCNICSVFFSNAADHMAASPGCKVDTDFESVDSTSGELHPVEDDFLPEDDIYLKNENETYVCEVCNESFQEADEMKKHLREHDLLNDTSKSNLSHDDNAAYLPFPCTQCGKSFSCSEYLHRHEQLHSQTQSCSCSACNNGLNIQQVNAKPYHCSTCGTSFACSKRLEEHKPLHLKSNKYFCTQCNRSYDARYIFLKHVCREKNICDVCNKSFRFLKRLEDHYEFIHPTIKEFSCNQCDKLFVSIGAMRIHRRRIHFDKLFSCDQCSQSFSAMTFLKVHKKNHLEKMFACDLCNMKFLRLSRLNRHKARHEEKIFKCQECQQTYPNANRLKKHRLKDGHTEGMLKCDECSRLFNIRRSLVEHKRVRHSPNEAAKMKCHICPKAYRDPFSLKVHIKRIHTVRKFVYNV